MTTFLSRAPRVFSGASPAFKFMNFQILLDTRIELRTIVLASVWSVFADLMTIPKETFRWVFYLCYKLAGAPFLKSLGLAFWRTADSSAKNAIRLPESDIILDQFSSMFADLMTIPKETFRWVFYLYYKLAGAPFLESLGLAFWRTVDGSAKNTVR